VQGDQIEEFWALKELNLKVKAGEVVGIIGHNGAGKSTLLKILSRITDPTKGRAVLRGRVASLLEVGTGFHPELSGRENIYLNGAILGMSRREIDHRFDEVVSFAEIERFLDTPVKRYSSGMYVRLAFAVAAHLDPEILIVDEVLAVGDAQFQRKCLGKMRDVSTGEGRTVLFVSHNLAAIKTLCHRALCLEAGKVVADGIPDVVIQRYLHANSDGLVGGEISEDRPRQYGTGGLLFRRVQLISSSGEHRRTIDTGEAMELRIQFTVKEPLGDLILEWGIVTPEGQQLTQSRWPRHASPPLCVEVGEYEISIRSEQILFPGHYSVLIAAHHVSGLTIDWIERALDFEVLNTDQQSELHHPWTVRGFLKPMDEWDSPRKIVAP
jgi:lipopolysaccharide transport system ATP-binding protein